MLWLCLYLPVLPLEWAIRGAADAGPAVIIEMTRHGERVLMQNSRAEARGIRVGMPTNAALALCPHVKRYRYDAAGEASALNGVAEWAMQFSSLVELLPPRTIGIEIGSSQRLLGDLQQLRRRVEAGLNGIGYTVSTAIAPYSAAACALSWAGRNVTITEPEKLSANLDELPLTVLGTSMSVQAQRDLEALGVACIGELARLPGNGLTERFGRDFSRQLDCLFGRHVEPAKPYQPALRHQVRVELPVLVENSANLVFACNRLLTELAGVLQGQCRGARRFVLNLYHERGEPTQLNIKLVRASHDAGHWISLVRTRLEQVQLDQPVSAVEITASDVETLTGETFDLFDNTRSSDQVVALIERLQARLGTAAVRGLATVADRRPERAWCWVAPRTPVTPAQVLLPQRPVWLFAEPKPVSKSTEWQLSGAERIEAGWWDGGDIARDYFIATTDHGERLWVFHDRRAGQWFVHGEFS